MTKQTDTNIVMALKSRQSASGNEIDSDEGTLVA